MQKLLNLARSAPFSDASVIPSGMHRMHLLRLLHWARRNRILAKSEDISLRFRKMETFCIAQSAGLTFPVFHVHVVL